MACEHPEYSYSARMKKINSKEFQLSTLVLFLEVTCTGCGGKYRFSCEPGFATDGARTSNMGSTLVVPITAPQNEIEVFDDKELPDDKEEEEPEPPPTIH